ncbi:MAG: branched-chain amino acid ABC transporter permease, partial [Deltaproteobacteria bacterium]|nr:branched-chain amino acid ABC transporter permease [Deltaproteobacteria bacterium]
MPPAAIWVDGLIQSCIYMTMAFGMVLVFSILGILNWAHGQFYMFGGIVVYYAVAAAGIPFPISLLISAVVVGALGMLVEMLIIERVNVPIYGPLYVGVATISLIFFFEGAASLLFGMQDKGLSMVFPGVLNLGSFSVSYQKISVVIFTMIVMITMYIVLNRTKIGFAIRAVAQEPVAANLYGISVKRISVMVMGIGCALAAMAGSIMAPIYPVNPFMGRVPMIMSLLAIVIGGIGSLTGAIMGGLILGFLNSVIAYKISYFSEVVLF